MQWWLVITLLFGGMVLLLLTNLPIAFAFLVVNMVAAYFFLGGLPGLIGVVTGTFTSITTFTLLPVPFFIKGFKVLRTNKKIKDLANAYVERGVFPEKYIDDALHVAVASFYDISYVVSWNFEHLVKVKTRKSVNLVNILEGYREIEIVSPQEL